MMPSPEERNFCSLIMAFRDHRFEYLFQSDLKKEDHWECMIYERTGGDFDERALEKIFDRITHVKAFGWSRPEELVDMAAKEANGAYLLILRTPVIFHKDTIINCIQALSSGSQKIGYLYDNRMIVVERSWHLGHRGIEGDRNQPAQIKSTAPQKSSNVLDLNNNRVKLQCGPNSYIDPDVIVDSPEAIKIGANTIIRKGVVMRPERGEIVIGDNCVINHYCVLHGKGGIYIDNWSIIAPHCGIYAQNHSYDRFDIPITKQSNHGKGIYIMGDNWVGSHTVICDDVSIGKGAVVGANSTVTKSVPMATIVAGSPARIIKKRYSEEWNFSQRERASVQGMPAGIYAHVIKRGKMVSDLLKAKDTVLDVACGEGILTEMISKKAGTIFACDYSYDTIVENQKRLPQIKFFYSNATSIRCPNSSFTAVVCSELAEHLLPDQFKRCLQEIYRVLIPGGTLVLTTPLTGKGRATDTYAHIFEYSKDQILNLLRKRFCNVTLVNEAMGLFMAKSMPK